MFHLVIVITQEIMIIRSDNDLRAIGIMKSNRKETGNRKVNSETMTY